MTDARKTRISRWRLLLLRYSEGPLQADRERSHLAQD